MSYSPYPPTQPEPRPEGYSPYPQDPQPQPQPGYSPHGYAQPTYPGQPNYPPQQPQYPGYQGYQQQGYGMAMVPASPYGHQVAPWGIDPQTGRAFSDKSKIVAGLLQIFLGGFGIGRFYKGDVGIGVAMIVVTLITFGFGAVWGFIDGIVLLVGNPQDRAGRPLRS